RQTYVERDEVRALGPEGSHRLDPGGGDRCLTPGSTKPELHKRSEFGLVLNDEHSTGHRRISVDGVLAVSGTPAGSRMTTAVPTERSGSRLSSPPWASTM